jgi:hypothetical protein
MAKQKRIYRKTYRKPYMPTPEQIRQSCLEIQAGWTAEEERERRGCLTPYQCGKHRTPKVTIRSGASAGGQ